MVEWLAGNRIRGTSAEKPVLGLPSGSVGGWVELGRSTASGGETSLSVSSLSDKQYYQVITTDHGIAGAPARLWRFNNDSGSNYSRRVSSNGAADGTSLNQTAHNSLSVNDTSQNLSIHYITNLSNKEKLQITHAVGGNSSAASVAPARVEFVGKWANTSDAINRIDYIANSGSFSSGDEVVVLGWDPADTHTTNFWEELASVSGDGSSTTLSTGTVIDKKYIWIQAYLETTGQQKGLFRVGNGSVDGAGSYSFRISNNGGSDAGHDVKGSLTEDMPDALHHFVNIFAVNNASNEGLFIGHDVGVVTTGAGTEPIRQEFVSKWANTSNQFNILDVVSGAGDGNWSSKSILKVWGSD
jgi:hypothetical protein